MNPKDRITELTNCINQLDTSYYVNNESLVCDAVYDITFQELVSLEQAYPEFRLMNSPTNRVSGGVSKEFATVKHSAPMLSIRTETEPSLQAFEKWKASIAKQLQPLYRLDFFAEYKFDGLGLSLTYQDNLLVSGLTRGDGEFGEDVTNNAKTIYGVPHYLESPVNRIDRLVIRGEVMMSHQVFKKLNETKVLLGEKPFANTRNAASGSLRQLDSSETAKRHLIFVPYQIVEYTCNGFEIKITSQREAYQIMKNLGFNPVFIYESVEKLLSSSSLSELAVSLRKKLPFDIDGYVVKVDRTSHQKKLGYRSREPNWAVAYKFQAEVAQTKLLAIDVQIGRTGKVTPVARLKPIQVGGTVVANVTLHNVFDLRARGVRVGDDIFVRRAGDVIPEISGYNPLSRKTYLPNFKMPTHCSSCGGKIKRLQGEREYYCTNTLQCKAQLKQAIMHYASRNAMNIQGLGEKIAEQLVDTGVVIKLFDIYTLSGSSFRNIEGMGDKTISNLLNAIEISKVTSFTKFMYALGIRNVGEGTAKALSTLLDSPDALAKQSVESLMKVNDIGKITAESIYSFFKIESNYFQVMAIWLNHLRVEKPVNASGVLLGKLFVVTGTFGETSREELKTFIEQHGGTFQKSVSKKTNYLVAGECGGSKREEASRLNVNIITMDDLYNLV